MTEVENISTHSKRPREPNYGSFPDASGINQVGAVDPLVAGTYLCTMYTGMFQQELYICIRVFQKNTFSKN